MNPDTQANTLARRTTAAGLEAWLTGASNDAPSTPAVAVPAGPSVPRLQPVASAAPAIEEAQEIGPVNAAEALVLGELPHAGKLTGRDGAELVVDPQTDSYFFESTSLKPLAVLLEQPASNWAPVYAEAMKTIRATAEAQPLERLRWFAGLVATPGILGRRLQSGQRVQLARWPETEREFPKHFRIAKAMLSAPATVQEIATASGMPLDEVTDYVNACHAAGRLKAEEAVEAAVAEPAPTSTRGRRLMSRLNKPLFAR